MIFKTDNNQIEISKNDVGFWNVTVQELRGQQREGNWSFVSFVQCMLFIMDHGTEIPSEVISWGLEQDGHSEAAEKMASGGVS